MRRKTKPNNRKSPQLSVIQVIFQLKRVNLIKGEVILAFKIRENVTDSEIIIEVLNLITVCPHTKSEDFTELKLTYKPGDYKGHRYIIDRDELADFIKNDIENRLILMEMIPVRILEHYIKSTAGRIASRYASPEWISITTTSRGKAKKFTMTTQVIFQREVK
jgi:NADPH-dependent 7-cyano-7-deazaguanine reductase QueF